MIVGGLQAAKHEYCALYCISCQREKGTIIGPLSSHIHYRTIRRVPETERVRLGLATAGGGEGHGDMVVWWPGFRFCLFPSPLPLHLFILNFLFVSLMRALRRRSAQEGVDMDQGEQVLEHGIVVW